MPLSRRHSPSRPMLAALLGLAVALAGLPWMPAFASATDDVVVSITSSVSPASLTVTPGTGVVFRNDDAERHRLRSRNGPADLDTGNIEPGESVTITLTAIGTYAYVDERDRYDAAYHGSIVVSADASPGSGDPGTGPEAAPQEAGVGMAGRAFAPSTLIIAAGGTVTFTNDDDRDHTVTSTEGSQLDSGIMAPGATYAVTFADPGVFAYRCLIHPDMTGTVEVVDTAAASPDPGPAAPQGSAVIGLLDFEMSPASLVVPVGTEVTFQNRGQAPHSATARDGSFDSGILPSGGSMAHTFEAPGTFELFCVVHPSMTGVIVVEEAGAPSG